MVVHSDMSNIRVARQTGLPERLTSQQVGGYMKRRRMANSSVQFVDTHEVACRIAEGAVADPVWLLGWLVGHLGAIRLQPRERSVEV